MSEMNRLRLLLDTIMIQVGHLKNSELEEILKIEPFSNYLRSIDDAGASNAESILRRSEKGFDVDLVTPIIGRNAEDPDAEREIYRDMMLNQLEPTGLSYLDVVEREQSEKIGSYSIMLPFNQRIPDVEKYFERRDTNYNPQSLGYALQRVSELLPRNVEPESSTVAFSNMPKGTNLGAPFFSSNEEYLRPTWDLVQQVERSRFRMDRSDPCIAFWRGQPRGIGLTPKQRTVWGMPHYIIVAELRLQMALLPRLINLVEFSAWNGADKVNEVITAMLDNTRQPILSVDFSGFDASIPGVLIDVCFALLKHCFVPSAARLIDYVQDQFEHINLLTPTGIMSGRDGGVPSGSGLTNLVDSIVQMLLAHYIAHRLRNEILTMTVQGDDGVWVFRRPVDTEEIAEVAQDFGVKLSDDKGALSRHHVHFLQNVHMTEYRLNGQCVGVRPIMRVLNGMLSYEHLRPGWSKYDDSIRWYQQAESARFHPQFKLLAQFLYDHDELSQFRTIDEIVRGGGGIEKIARVLKQPSFPYGKAPLSGIRSFEIIKEITAIREHASEPG